LRPARLKGKDGVSTQLARKTRIISNLHKQLERGIEFYRKPKLKRYSG
jgi:hypothetical protein